jgi:uncharacterized Fe-S cluster-containing MiaB family protein
MLTSAIARTVSHLLTHPGVRVATTFLSEKRVVRATRKRYRGRLQQREDEIDIVLTVGRPNFVARERIKLLKRAGEPFPVRKVHLQFAAPQSC